MTITLEESLARTLSAIYMEALGYPEDWDKHDDKYREAWVQVAQFVMARSSLLIDEKIRRDNVMNDFSIEEPDHR